MSQPSHAAGVDATAGDSAQNIGVIGLDVQLRNRDDRASLLGYPHVSNIRLSGGAGSDSATAVAVIDADSEVAWPGRSGIPPTAAASLAGQPRTRPAMHPDTFLSRPRRILRAMQSPRRRSTHSWATPIEAPVLPDPYRLR